MQKLILSWLDMKCIISKYTSKILCNILNCLICFTNNTCLFGLNYTCVFVVTLYYIYAFFYLSTLLISVLYDLCTFVFVKKKPVYVLQEWLLLAICFTIVKLINESTFSANSVLQHYIALI